MAAAPLVTVICLSFNHIKYVEEAFLSVINQTYREIQLIMVDDGSTDGSRDMLAFLYQQNPRTDLILLPHNAGNCKAFNQALARANGKYVIDLSADDILLPNRIAEQVAFFESQAETTGLIFSDCEMISETGQFLHTHYKRDSDQKLLENVPSGFVFQEILRKYFICTPSMMMRKTMLDALGGYNEKLSYEDFDLWVRASPKWAFGFQDAILTKKRVLKKSLGTGFYHHGENRHLRSTLLVCKKALALCVSQEDKEALSICVSYHLRQSLFCEDYQLVKDYYSLQRSIKNPSLSDKVSRLLASLHFPLYHLYALYRKIK